MAHHKRTGPKSTRGGCLLCKPHKRQGSKLSERQPFRVRRQTPPSPELHRPVPLHEGSDIFKRPQSFGIECQDHPPIIPNPYP